MSSKPANEHDILLGCSAVIVAAATLNLLIRPTIAAKIGGERVVVADARPRDMAWAFDEATKAAHPALTAFLETPDGAINLAALVAMVAIFALWAWQKRAFADEA